MTCIVDVTQMHGSKEGRRRLWVFAEVFQTLDWLNRVSRTWNWIYSSSMCVCAGRCSHIMSLTITVATVSAVTCGTLARKQLSLARHALCGCVTVMISRVTGIYIFWLRVSSCDGKQIINSNATNWANVTTNNFLCNLHRPQLKKSNRKQSKVKHFSKSGATEFNS